MKSCAGRLPTIVLVLMFASAAKAAEAIDIGDPRIGPPEDPLSINSESCRISRSGVFVAFHCYADNVVANDTNGLADVFVLNRYTGACVRASVHTDGSQADGTSKYPRISGNGRYIVFNSDATNLVDGDTNGVVDVFLHDRVTQTTHRISVASDGAQGNGDCTGAAISADGRYVVFASLADNLSSGDTNFRSDIFVRDTFEETTVRASVDTGGGPVNGHCIEPSISADGRCVAFKSDATDIVENDNNGKPDIFVRDMLEGTNYRASITSEGAESDGFTRSPSLSDDGRYVAFISGADNLDGPGTNSAWDGIVHDCQTGATTVASVSSLGEIGNKNTLSCEMSGDGACLVFRSFATNLVPQDTNNKGDIFMHELASGATTRLSVSAAGQEANDDSFDAAISESGAYAAFLSQATNLHDEASEFDVFRVFLRGPALPPRGDCSGDGVVDGEDIAMFCQAWSDADASYELRSIADMDDDGEITPADALRLSACLLYAECDDGPAPGDCSGDGLVDGDDVASFHGALVGAVDSYNVVLAADMNRDGSVTLDDVPLFIERLLHGPG